MKGGRSILLILFAGIIIFTACKQKKVKRENEIGDNTTGFVTAFEDIPDQFAGEFDKAADLISKNKVDEAIEVYDDLLPHESAKAIAYAGLGACYNIKNEFGPAIKFYRKSLEIDPACVTSLMGMGSAYYSTQEYDSSILYYNKVMEKDEEYPDVYWGLALVYDETGNLEKAKENARIFIRLAPESIYREQLESILKK